MSRQALWDDASLIEAISGGGSRREQALAWWFADEQLHHWVSQYVQRHQGTVKDGEDIYHDTFICFDRLIREGKYRQEASLKTFFCSIAKWQWLNHMRKLGRTVELDYSEEPVTEHDLYDREKQAVFQQMLGSLGEKCKRLLTLYQLNYNMKEIAAEMGYGSDQVAMNQASLCRKKLKELIENSKELRDFFNIRI